MNPRRRIAYYLVIILVFLAGCVVAVLTLGYLYLLVTREGMPHDDAINLLREWLRR